MSDLVWVASRRPGTKRRVYHRLEACARSRARYPIRNTPLAVIQNGNVRPCDYCTG